MTEMTAQADESQSNAELREKLELALTANKQYETELREREARDLFRNLGYPEQHAELYLQTSEGAVTPESVSEFASKYQLAPQAPDTRTTPTPTVNTDGISFPGQRNPIAQVGGVSGTSAADPHGAVTIQTFHDMYARDPEGTNRALMAGQISIKRTDSARSFTNLAVDRQPPKPVE